MASSDLEQFAATNVPGPPRFREMFAVMMSNKWLIIGLAAGMMILFPFLMSFRPPTCEGVSVVLINAKAGQVVNPLQQGNENTTNKMQKVCGTRP